MESDQDPIRAIERGEERLREYFRTSILIITAFLTAVAFTYNLKPNIDESSLFNQYVIFGLLLWVVATVINTLFQISAATSRHEGSPIKLLKKDPRTVDRYANTVLVIMSTSALLLFSGLVLAVVFNLLSIPFTEENVTIILILFVIIVGMYVLVTHMYSTLIPTFFSMYYELFHYLTIVYKSLFTIDIAIAYQKVPWMDIIDYRILAIVSESDVGLTSADIASRLSIEIDRVQDRCSELSRRGYLHQNRLFVIELTEEGRDLLELGVPREEIPSRFNH